jgi:hypothetical protein
MQTRGNRYGAGSKALFMIAVFCSVFVLFLVLTAPNRLVEARRCLPDSFLFSGILVSCLGDFTVGKWGVSLRLLGTFLWLGGCIWIFSC